MIQKPDQPQSAATLEQAKANGALRPLDRQRLRAQLGLVDRIVAADVRRATELLLQRLIDYYEVIQYTGPGYVYGRVSSSWPSALYAEARYNSMYSCWQHIEMSPVHPTCTLEMLVSEAGWMCTDTAAKVAKAEMAEEVPEAGAVLAQARYAVESLLGVSSVSGVLWSDSRRRLRTAGIRKVLTRVRAALPEVTIGIGVIRPVVLGPGDSAKTGIFKDVSDWSWPAMKLAASA